MEDSHIACSNCGGILTRQVKGGYYCARCGMFFNASDIAALRERSVARENAENIVNIAPTESVFAKTHVNIAPTEGVFAKLDRATAKIIAVNGNDASCGTAWFINYNNYNKYLVTNYHVIENANSVSAKFSKNIDPRCENYSAKVVATDEDNDLALIQLDADLGNMNVLSGRTSLKIANIDNVKAGDEVCTLGNPLGISFVLTTGRISGIGYGDYGFDKTRGYNRFLVDITSTNGSSGGAVCNGQGEVVGVLTQGCEEVLPRQAACVSCLAVQQLMAVYYKKNK